MLATGYKAWYYTRHMKYLGLIACAGSALLLGSCTLTSELPQTDAETSPALDEAARELDEALQQQEEEDRDTEEKQEAPEQKAPEKDTAAAAAPERVPQLFSSRGRRARKPAEVTPTQEQQQAAIKLLAEQAKPRPKPGKKLRKRKAPHPEESDLEQRALPGSALGGNLRSRRFAPPEEYDSSNDDDAPLPNSVELRGFRSPVLKGRLPMNLDGKIIKED